MKEIKRVPVFLKHSVVQKFENTNAIMLTDG